MDAKTTKLNEIKDRVSGKTVGIYDGVCQKHDVEWLIKEAEETEQVKAAYADRVDDVKSLEKIILEIKEAYENDDENVLDEYLHGLFTNEVFEDY